MKKKVLAIASLAIVIALSVAGSTMAYMTSSDSQTNDFSAGTLQTDIIENGSSTPSTSNVIPAHGVEAKKQVMVENVANTSGIDAYIRVALIPSWVVGGNTQMGDLRMPATAAAITKGNNIDLGTGDRSVTLYLHENWSKYWIYKDGYFYYKKVVPSGGQTASDGKDQGLLQRVILGDKDYWSQFNLEVLSDSVQAGGNAISQIDGWKDAVTISPNGDLISK